MTLYYCKQIERDKYKHARCDDIHLKQCQDCWEYQHNWHNNPPHYPVPTTLLRAYTDLYGCVDMRCNYWEPSR